MSSRSKTARSLPASLAEPARRKRQSALVEGFSLHAAVHLHANDREGLEKFRASCSFHGDHGDVDAPRTNQKDRARLKTIPVGVG